MTHTHEHLDAFSASGLLHILEDALLDTLKVLPFLFAAFLLLEFLEKHAGDRLNRFFLRAGRAGPLVGAALGCVPQCGFSVLSATYMRAASFPAARCWRCSCQPQTKRFCCLPHSPGGTWIFCICC